MSGKKIPLGEIGPYVVFWIFSDFFNTKAPRFTCEKCEKNSTNVFLTSGFSLNFPIIFNAFSSVLVSIFGDVPITPGW